MAQTPSPAKSKSFVGVQLGPHSVFDEGAERCLDTLQENGAINAVFVYSHTYQGYSRGRKPTDLAPDHGVRIPDPASRNLPLVWARPHEEYYKDTFLRHAKPAANTEFQGKDVFETLADPCRKRGIRLFARILEGHGRTPIENIAGWTRILTVDAWGRTTNLPCWNHPAYRAWWLGTVEDLFKTYPLAGLKWEAERSGPLSNILVPSVWAKPVSICFCEHCLAQGNLRGIHLERAREGMRKLTEFADSMRAGGQAPADGIYVSLLRLLMRFPEVLAWEQLWHDSKESLKQQMYGIVKQINPNASVGWHIYHAITWDPIYRAMADYSRMTGYSDWIKPVVYHDVAGPRVKDVMIDPLHKGMGREIPAAELLQVLYGVLGYDRQKEPAYDQLSSRGFSPDYVYRETKRCVDAVAGRCAVYSGVGFDVPLQPSASSPDLVYDACSEAFRAGAKGLVVSREYDEMRIPNLKAVGRAVREKDRA